MPQPNYGALGRDNNEVAFSVFALDAPGAIASASVVSCIGPTEIHKLVRKFFFGALDRHVNGLTRGCFLFLCLYIWAWRKFRGKTGHGHGHLGFNDGPGFPATGRYVTGTGARRTFSFSRFCNKEAARRTVTSWETKRAWRCFLLLFFPAFLRRGGRKRLASSPFLFFFTILCCFFLFFSFFLIFVL